MSTTEKINLSALKIHRDSEKHSTSNTSGNRKIIYVVAIIVLVVLILFLARGLFTSDPVVETTTATFLYPSQANQVLVASGYIVAQRKAAVASKGTGRLVRLNFIEGDQVKKNDIIAQIESSDIEAMLHQARANVELANATLDQSNAELQDAESNFNRIKMLFDKSTVSQSEFDIAEARFKRAAATVKSAEAGVRAYQAGVRSVEVQMENTRIRAPFDGTILTKNADVGEVVAPFGAASNSRGAVVMMADMSSLEVEADVSESNIEKISDGQPCEITLDAFPEKRYRGVVGKIVPTADRAKATVLTKVRFIDRDSRVLPEMSAKVSFLTEALSDSAASEKPKLVISAAAIVSKDGAKYVFVIKENVLARRNVTLGDAIGGSVEVLQGLSAGESVVLKPAENLTDGMKVKTGKE